MYAEIAAAVQSAKTLADLVRSANGLSNHVEMTVAVNAVQEKLSQALLSNLAGAEKQAALQERVGNLEKQIAEAEGWSAQMQRYQLFKFPTGSMAYAVKRNLEADDPLYYICASCADKKQRSILQPTHRYLNCPMCKTKIEIQHYNASIHDQDPNAWGSR